MSKLEHPNEHDLAAYFDGEADASLAERVASHLSSCASCAKLLDNAEQLSDKLTNALPPTLMPDSYAKALELDELEPSEPTVGQVWNFSWKGTSSIGVVLDTDALLLLVAPVSSDLHLADDGTVRATAGGVFETPIGIWTRLAQHVPMRVARSCIGELDKSVLRDIEDVRNGTQAGIGTPVLSPLDERSQHNSGLAEELGSLASATWLPESSESSQHVDIKALLKEYDIAPRQAADALGMTQAELTDVARNKRALQPEQLRKLEEVISAPTGSLTHDVPIPKSLVEVLDSPRNRMRLLKSASRHGYSESEWRYEVATQRLPLAARSTSNTQDKSYFQGLLEDFLSHDEP